MRSERFSPPVLPRHRLISKVVRIYAGSSWEGAGSWCGCDSPEPDDIPKCMLRGGVIVARGTSS